MGEEIDDQTAGGLALDHAGVTVTVRIRRMIAPSPRGGASAERGRAASRLATVVGLRSWHRTGGPPRWKTAPPPTVHSNQKPNQVDAG